MRRPLACGLLVAGAIAPASCRDATQIIVEARTDLECSKTGETSFTVGRPGETESSEPTAVTTHCTPGSGEIGTLVVTPESAPDAELSVRLTMHVNGTGDCRPPKYEGCIVARRRLRYVPHQTLHLPITLSALCLDVGCDAESTCSAGACVSPTVTTPDTSTDSGAPQDASIVVPSRDGGSDTEGVVLCKPLICTIPSACCFVPGVGGTCVDDVVMCSRDVLRCDGPEDCGLDAVCCGNGAGGASCLKTIACPPELILCHGIADCPATMTCPHDYLGTFGHCMR